VEREAEAPRTFKSEERKSPVGTAEAKEPVSDSCRFQLEEEVEEAEVEVPSVAEKQLAKSAAKAKATTEATEAKMARELNWTTELLASIELDDSSDEEYEAQLSVLLALTP
jgi:hypothetical protein